MSLILLFFSIIICILFRSEVITGAKYGLLIWYENVIPVLLPFILISKLLVINISKYISCKSNKKSKRQSLPIITIILTGIFCGCPIGAKTGNDFIIENQINKRLCLFLLPLANNISPMFIAGYIGNIIFQNQIPVYILFLVIYIPNLIISGFLILTYSLKKSCKNNNLSKNNYSKNNNLSKNNYSKNNYSGKKNTIKKENKTLSNSFFNECITQITVIGIYIMIFSIISELIFFFSKNCIYAKIIAAYMEITKGTDIINNLQLNNTLKTALILSITSFGGFSAIYQTKEVTKASGLSINIYIILKLISSILSGFLAYYIIRL